MRKYLLTYCSVIRAPGVCVIAGSLLAYGLLAGCATTPATTGAVTTLATVAAASNKTVAGLVTGGQLFCSKAGGVVALVADLSKPTSVIGATAAVVAAACGAIQGVPVPAPTAVPLDTVPVVASAAAAALGAV